MRVGGNFGLRWRVCGAEEKRRESLDPSIETAEEGEAGAGSGEGKDGDDAAPTPTNAKLVDAAPPASADVTLVGAARALLCVAAASLAGQCWVYVCMDSCMGVRMFACVARVVCFTWSC